MNYGKIHRPISLKTESAASNYTHGSRLIIAKILQVGLHTLHKKPMFNLV
jgi:hypothetical protein